MKAWIVFNKEGHVRGITTWKESYAWSLALNQCPNGVTMRGMIDAFKMLGWKCKEYDLIEVKEGGTDMKKVTLYIESYSWTCPSCGLYHLIPYIYDRVTCERCEKTFEVCGVDET